MSGASPSPGPDAPAPVPSVVGQLGAEGTGEAVPSTAELSGVVFRRISRRSKCFRKATAASTRSFEPRVMTPRVRWRVPSGRIAFAGIEGVVAEAGAGMEGGVTAAVKWWREVRSCGAECEVRRGRQRKWVRGGRGGRRGRGGILGDGEDGEVRGWGGKLRGVTGERCLLLGFLQQLVRQMRYDEAG